MRGYHNTIRQKLDFSPTFIPHSTKIDLFVYILKTVIIVGRHFTIILFLMTSLNISLAVNDFLVDNLVSASLNSLFALSGIVSLVQLQNRNGITLSKYNTIFNKFTGDVSQTFGRLKYFGNEKKITRYVTLKKLLQTQWK